MTGRWKSECYVSDYTQVRALLRSDWVQGILGNVNLPKGSRVIELGCGSGKFSCAFAMLGYEAWAVDNNPEMLERVRKNFPDTDITLVYSELPELRGVPRNTFSVSLSEGVVEHFLDRPQRIEVIRAHRSVCRDVAEATRRMSIAMKVQMNSSLRWRRPS